MKMQIKSVLFALLFMPLVSFASPAQGWTNYYFNRMVTDGCETKYYWDGVLQYNGSEIVASTTNAFQAFGKTIDWENIVIPIKINNNVYTHSETDSGYKDTTTITIKSPSLIQVEYQLQGPVVDDNKATGICRTVMNYVSN